LALILWLFCALLGHKQGAIRASISFVGILVSGLLAWPLSGLVTRLLDLVVHHRITVWMISPIIAFVILLAVFKWIGFLVHRKVWIHYYYARNELQLAFWQRLNRRVGLAIGFLNAFAYLALISVPIYNVSYWTMQIAPFDQEKFTFKLMNRLGHDLESTGMAKVACAIDPLPDKFFKTADLVGMLRQNPQLAGRLAAYPPFLPLGQRDEFKSLIASSDFLNTWQTFGLFSQFSDNPQLQSLWQNQTTVDLVWNLTEANLGDLSNYLRTGQSAKYDVEPILGCWDVNIMESLRMALRSRSNVPSNEMAEMRALWETAYAKTVFIAAPDSEAFFTDFPQFMTQSNQPPTYTLVALQGSWQGGGDYEVTLAGNGLNKSASGRIDNSELILNMGDERLILDREKH